jgi:hypothetical protein
MIRIKGGYKSGDSAATKGRLNDYKLAQTNDAQNQLYPFLFADLREVFIAQPNPS